MLGVKITGKGPNFGCGWTCSKSADCLLQISCITHTSRKLSDYGRKLWLWFGQIEDIVRVGRYSMDASGMMYIVCRQLLYNLLF
jgi:hypothetical protein